MNNKVVIYQINYRIGQHVYSEEAKQNDDGSIATI